MKSATLASVLLGHLVAFCNAVPTPTEDDNKRDLSLPPLIPSIPGVTEPLVSAIPPLPILQFPTPPLDSPPFPIHNIKPKKIGHFWTGAGDNHHKDFLVTTSLDDVSISLSPTVY